MELVNEKQNGWGSSGFWYWDGGGVIQFTGGAENKWRLFISFGVFDLSACNISSPPWNWSGTPCNVVWSDLIGPNGCIFGTQTGPTCWSNKSLNFILILLVSVLVFFSTPLYIWIWFVNRYRWCVLFIVILLYVFF